MGLPRFSGRDSGVQWTCPADVETDSEEVEVTTDAAQAWLDLLACDTPTLPGAADCTPGHHNEGQEPTSVELENATGYPEGSAADFEFIDSWREVGTFDGIAFR